MSIKETLQRFDEKKFKIYDTYNNDFHCINDDPLSDDIKQFITEEIKLAREETLKELIREYQDNELDGKGYDFYFSIRAKIDKLNKLKKYETIRNI